jgi:Protein of unknown function (DUF3987)
MDLASHFEEICRRLRGEPNWSLSKKGEFWRYGAHGSLKCNIGGPHKGTFCNFENDNKGGVLDFIHLEGGIAKGEEWGWLRREFSWAQAIGRAFNIVAIYDYLDENSALLAQVCRLDPKSFRQRRPDGKGGWIWRLGDTRRVLYRLPDLVRARQLSGGQPWRIYIVEGEKDADRLASQWQMLATTSLGGAGKWRPEYGSFLTGADTVLLPDNDDVGRNHMQQVARAILPHAARVRIVELPGLPEKGDIGDWLDAGGTQGDLAKLIDAVPPIIESPPPNGGDTGRPAFRDPWADPAPPVWPSDILPAPFEDMVAMLAEAGGIDAGAQGLAALAAVSGAAPKNARFLVYDQNWEVPPIIWLLDLASSGERKTQRQRVFSALQEKHAKLWRRHTYERDVWYSLPNNKRYATPKPAEPHSFVLTDSSPEKVQIILSRNNRGSLLLRDELAGFFSSFGRYGNHQGGPERAFYLESYEGGPYTISRVHRDSFHIEVNGLTIVGYLQPERLSEFRGLDTDGLLQRFIVIRPAPAILGRPIGAIVGKKEFDDVIGKLAEVSEPRRYRTTQEGSDVVRKVEADAIDFGKFTGFGPGFSGFCKKLHGTMSRLALVLHLLEHPDGESEDLLIHPDTILKSERLVREFVLPHAFDFYASLSPERVERTRDIAAWLLTSDLIQIRASDLKRGVAAVKHLSLAELNEALDPLVGGGWMTPEQPYPSNRKWMLEGGVRMALGRRLVVARDRQEHKRRIFERIRAGNTG